MANIYEKNINEMMSDLNALKENAIDVNVCDLNKSQINVQSMGSDEVVIHLNLKKNAINVSSSGDQNDGQRSPNSKSDSMNKKSKPERKSQNSANDFQDCDPTQDMSNKSNKSRFSRRTISESINEDTKKGILKYSYNWNRRTVSESHCDSVDPDLELLSMFWHSVEDVYSDDDFSYENEKKHKKNVRFSENVSKTVFRPNSSILGRKLKNQKRSKNRKINRKVDTNSSENDGIKCESERVRQDSGYDSEENINHIPTEVSLKAHHKSSDFSIETGIEKLNFK